ncbi:MAG: hypothetical protein RLZZ153_1158, partial [Pseudomonadota bacterium]
APDSAGVRAVEKIADRLAALAPTT